MCNNNCCMCCQCDNTHDEDTPQEITYTSVCDSDACKNKCKCCCCDNGICEDDASLMVLGLSEKMEECCDEVHKTLESIACQIEGLDDKIDGEIERSTLKDDEHDLKNKEQNGRLNTLEYNESLDFNRAVYVTRDESQDHKAYIEFYHNENYMGRISAEPFLKDGIIDRVDLESDGHTLHFVWNTDAGKQDSHVDLNRLVQPVAQELSEYKTYVANTYETQVAAGNHIKNVDYDQNDHHTLIFTKENGQTITRTIPDADKYIQSGEYTGGNLVLTKNDGSTVTIPVPATNHIVGGSIDGRVITLTRENNGTPVTIQLPADANTYPVSGVVNGTTLTITNSDNSTVPITLPAWVTTDNDHYPTAASIDSSRVLHLTGSNFTEVTVQLPQDVDTNDYPTAGSVDSNDVLTLSSATNNFPTMTVQLPNYSRTDNDHYVTSGTVDNGVLKLTRDGVNGTVDIQLPAGADGNNYVTSATFANNTLTLGRNGGLLDVTCNIPIPAADNTNPITDVSQSGDTVTFTYKDNTSETITVGGNTNVTYGGNTVTLQQAITAIENRLNALEGLWEINPNDSTQLVAKSSRSAKAAGFYDSTVS